MREQTKAVVTGGAGFIGSNIADGLVRRGWQVIILDNLSTGRIDNIQYIVRSKKAEFINGSITDLTLLQSLFSGVDYVFHQAAIPSVPRSVDDPAASNEANVTGTLNVLMAARDNKVRKVVFASSSSVYGDTPTLPKREDMTPNPLSPYALTKLAGEHYCQIFQRVYDLPTVCLRYFNVYGPRQNPDSQYAAVISKFIKDIMEGKSPPIFGDGEQSRDFTFVKDVVSANLLAAETNAEGVFNVGMGEKVTLNQLVQLMTALLKRPDIQPEYVRERVGDIKHSLADITRARAFGYNPQYPIEKGLIETISSLRTQTTDISESPRAESPLLSGPIASGTNPKSLSSTQTAVMPKTKTKIDIRQSVVCVVGAGYVGLPLSEAFARKLKTISYDIDDTKIKMLTERNSNPKHSFTSNPNRIAEADFICISVPTPITKSKDPDMSYVKASAKVIGQHMKKGVVVILESSVVPGVTEEVIKPILAQESGYQYGAEFRTGYSPERINPGDILHNIDQVTKIVSADNKDTLELLDELYHYVTPNVFKATSIKTAEAAKLVENTQRDLNIALVNELSIIFEKMGLSTREVLDAAATKWNFQRFSPGLVGGYCIPVVPYFLVHKAEEYGYHPQVILAGRAINDYIPKHIAEMAIKSINNVGKVIKGSRVLVMGCTYKENVEDTRETPVRNIIRELLDYGVDVWGYDPIAKDPEKAFGIRFINSIFDSPTMDCVIITVAHDAFSGISIDSLRKVMNSHPILIDIRGLFDTPEMHNSEFIYKHL